MTFLFLIKKRMSSDVITTELFSIVGQKSKQNISYQLFYFTLKRHNNIILFIFFGLKFDRNKKLYQKNIKS